MNVRRREGQSLIEFALVLPLLLILVFGIIDFSIGLYDKAVITNASREGARAGIVAQVPRLTEGQIQDVVLKYCSGHLVTFGSGTLKITVVAGKAYPDDLVVTVTYPYQFAVISRLIPSLGSPTLRATTTMKME
jgi:Flp pilus assembly protein TadG